MLKMYREMQPIQRHHDLVSTLYTTITQHNTVNDESLEWLMFSELAFEESWRKKVW